MGPQGVSQCFGCGVVGEGEVDIDDGNFYCVACWLVYHAAQARLWQDTSHVQLARNLQGVAYAPGSAQHERSVEDVSLTLGRRPQLQRPGACTEHQRACTQITTQAAHAHDLEAEFTQVWDRKVCPSVLGVGWSVKARWTLTMGTFIVSHAGWSTTQRTCRPVRDYWNGLGTLFYKFT
jgi:hypothetical protein